MHLLRSSPITHPTLLILALMPSLHSQDLTVESVSFPAPTQVSITAMGLPDEPSTLRLRTSPDLVHYTDASFPFFTDLGNGRFSLRGTHNQPPDQAFFQVQVETGSESYTPDLSIGVASRSEESGFGAWTIGTAENAVYTGEIKVSFTGSGDIGGLALPFTHVFNMRSARQTLQTFGGFDDTEVNGPRYVYMRIINDEDFGDGAVLEHLVIIRDNDAYFRGFIDAPGFPFEFRLKYARTSSPSGVTQKVQVFELESDGSGVLPAGTYPLDGNVSSSTFEASGGIHGATTFGDGLEVDLEVEFLQAGSALESSGDQLNRITGTARITQRVVSKQSGGSPTTIKHLTRVIEGPYTLTREPAPIRNLSPGLLPQ